jgi:hypothetical protein
MTSEPFERIGFVATGEIEEGVIVLSLDLVQIGP